MAKSPATERVIDKSEPTPVASPASTKRRDHDKAPTASKPAYNSETRDATSRPYIIERVSLQSHPAQQVVKRQYEIVDTRMYQLSVVMRVLTTEKGAEAVEGLVDREFDALTADLSGEIERLEVLVEQHGLEDVQVQYSEPRDYELKMSSPRSRRYIAMLRRLDHLVSLMYLLWFGGLMTEQQYTQGTYKWQRTAMQAGNRVIQTSTRALAAARRLSKEAGGAVAVSKAKARVGDAPTGSMAELMLAELSAAPPPTLAGMKERKAGGAPANDEERDAKFSYDLMQVLQDEMTGITRRPPPAQEELVSEGAEGVDDDDSFVESISGGAKKE